MKQLSSFAACAIVLAIAAAPAGAQDSAFIQQVEANASMATIDQIGSLGNNYATIDQYLAPSAATTATTPASFRATSAMRMPASTNRAT